MFRTVLGRLGPGNIEFLPFYRTVRGRQVACRRVDGNGNDRIRFREIDGRFGGQAEAHESFPDRGSDSPSGKTFSPGFGLSYPTQMPVIT